MSKHPRLSGVIALHYAALPIQERDGETRVVLVTSRETHRWMLPKGWGEKSLTGAQVAAKEAFEEAGIREPWHGPEHHRAPLCFSQTRNTYRRDEVNGDPAKRESDLGAGMT